jgi:EAL domain-containing protein (putative c-di-GMP-specific phosphodiesterase class I)
MIREMLQNQFGMATGTNIDFKLTITSLQQDITDARSINEIIDKSIQSVSTVGSPYIAITRDQFIKIIERREIETYLQPIVSLAQESIVGYEALSRGPMQSPVHRADLLFGTAANLGLTQELELACVARALDWAAKVPVQYWFSINIGTALLTDPAFWDLISRDQLKPILPRLVFELTEHLPIDLAQEVQEAVHDLKGRGIRLALDDTGCGFANLFAVETLRPEIVKLCITVISWIGRSRDVAQEIQEIADRIAQLGGSTLGEGVERKEQVEVLKQCGVSLAQGYYFGHPKPAQEVLASNT